jgi:putative peptidoglycan lipid II flippase
MRSAAVISAAVLMSRVTGLLRESVLSWMLGAGAANDAYVLGYRIPGLLRELLAEGALSSAFVPTFTRYLTTKPREETRELSNIMGTMVLLIAGLLTLAGIVTGPWLVDIFAPGFGAVPGKRELAVTLLRTMFPCILLLALSAQAQGILYSRGRFGTAAVSSSLANLGTVVFGLALGYGIGPAIGMTPVRGMACGAVLGAATQLVFQLPSVWSEGFAWKPRWNMRRNLRHEGVRHILRLMGPAILGSASGQLNVLVTLNLAAGLRDAQGHVMNGPVSWLSYANRFLALPMGLFAVSIATATLPSISRSAAERNFDDFRVTLARSIVMILMLTLPAAAGLAVLGESMIGIVFQHGKFVASDTVQTGLALQGFALGLAGYSVLRLVTPAFYALGDSRTPMLVSLSAVVVNAATAWSLVRVFGMGHAGLALSTSVLYTFSALTLMWLIRGKIGGINGRAMAGRVAKILAATVATAGVCRVVVVASHQLMGLTFGARMVDVAVGIPAGAAAFYGVAAGLGMPELQEARAAVMKELGRAA